MEEDPASYDLSTDIERNVTHEDKNMSNRRNNQIISSQYSKNTQLKIITGDDIKSQVYQQSPLSFTKKKDTGGQPFQNVNTQSLRKGAITAAVQFRKFNQSLQNNKNLFFQKDENIAIRNLEQQNKNNFNNDIIKQFKFQNSSRPVKILIDEKTERNSFFSKIQSSRKDEEQKVCKLIQSVKFDEIETDPKQGMSVYHQNTYQNYLKNLRQPSKNQAHHNIQQSQRISLRKEDLHLMDSMMSFSNGSKDYIDLINSRNSQRFSINFEKKQNQFQIALNTSRTSEENDKPYNTVEDQNSGSRILPSVEKSKDNTPQYFKKEIYKQSFRAQQLYKNENQQIQQIYRANLLRKQLLLQNAENQEYISNPTQYFKNAFADNSKDQIQQKIDQNLQTNNLKQNRKHNFSNLFKVQTDIMNFDDILQNRQFFNITQKANRQLKSQQRDVNKNFLLKYRFEHNLSQDPKRKQKKIMDLIGRTTYTQRQILSPQHIQTEREQNLNPIQVNREDQFIKSDKLLVKNFDQTKINQNNQKFYIKINNEEYKNNFENYEYNESQKRNINEKREKLDLQTNKNLQDLLRKLDDQIQQGPHDLDEYFEDLNYQIKNNAQELYKLVYDIDKIDQNDKRYKIFMLNVFKKVSSDPLDNKNSVCGIKNCVSLLDGFLNVENFKNALSKKSMRLVCAHTHQDDAQLQKYYSIQNWFLNFCKLIYITLINNQINQDQKAQIQENQEMQISQRHQKFFNFKLMNLSKNPKENFKKEKQKKLNIIVNNLKKSFDEMSKEQKQIFKSKSQIENIIKHPLLKIVLMTIQSEIIEYKLQNLKEMFEVFELNEDKDISISELASLVINHYQKEIIQVRKSRNVTFKNFATNKQEQMKFFDQDQELHNQDFFIKNQTEIIMNESQQFQIAEDQKELQSQNESKSQILQNQSPIIDKSIIGISPNKNSLAMQMSKKDMVKQLVYIVNERKLGELLKLFEKSQFNDHVSTVSLAFEDFKNKFSKKQKIQQSADQKQQEQKFQYEFSKSLPVQLKDEIVNILRHKQQKTLLDLQEQEEAKYKFFKKAKQLALGTEDNFDDDEIKYFKDCKSQKILEMPIFFKSIQNNQLLLKGQLINFEQAVSIKNILIQAGDHQVLNPNQINPYIVKALIIDGCSMTDLIFEQILIGIQYQNQLKLLHYVNNNFLGIKSALIICDIFMKNTLNQFINELNLSNIVIERTEKAGELNPLQLILNTMQKTQLINRLKISNLNLRQDSKSINLITEYIEQNSHNLKYLNISNCNISLKDLIKITNLLQHCLKLEYIDISWNILPQFSNDEVQLLIVQLASNISLILKEQFNQLKYFDISGLTFQREQLKIIFDSLKINTQLNSFRLNIEYGDDRKFIAEILGIQKIDQLFEQKNYGDKLTVKNQTNFDQFYINSSLGKSNSINQKIKSSSLFSKNNLDILNPFFAISLQRYSQNHELLHNPATKFGSYDPDVSQKWFIRDNCFLKNRHIYSVVFFNQKNLNKNTFKPMQNQENFMKKIDYQLQADQDLKTPIILIHGIFYKMMVPQLYTSKMELESIILEKIQQVEMQPNGAVEVTAFNVATLNQKMKELQEQYQSILASITEQQIKEMLIDISNEIIDQSQIKQMSDIQRRIAINYEEINWERALYGKIGQSNAQYYQIINPQKFEYEGKIKKYVQNLDDQKILKEQSDQISLQSQKRMKESIKQFDKNIDFSPSVYMFAGFLPPGKNTIYLYDRQNRKVFQKDVLVDMTKNIFGKDGPDWLHNFK